MKTEEGDQAKGQISSLIGIEMELRECVSWIRDHHGHEEAVNDELKVRHKAGCLARECLQSQGELKLSVVRARLAQQLGWSKAELVAHVRFSELPDFITSGYIDEQMSWIAVKRRMKEFPIKALMAQLAEFDPNAMP